MVIDEDGVEAANDAAMALVAHLQVGACGVGAGPWCMGAWQTHRVR